MSSMQREQLLIPTGIIWECRQVATQPVGAPATMGYSLQIPEGERGLLLGAGTGPDDYGAGRVITTVIRRSDTSVALYFTGSDSVDNVQIVLPPIMTSITETTMTSFALGVPYMPYILPELTLIVVTGGSLANAETITGFFHIATRLLPPIAVIIGSGVTLTTNTILQV